MKSGWKIYFLATRNLVGWGAIIFLIVQLILVFYPVPESGFSGKTFWEWMDLFIIPLVLAGGAFFLNRSEKEVERKAAETRAKLEREIARDRQQEDALQAYIDKMSELLLEKKLRTTDAIEVRDVARTRTISVMRVLDTKRNDLVIQFLREAKLIIDENSILNGADMEGMYLQGLNFQEVFIQKANLAQINLEGAYLARANMTEVNFSVEGDGALMHRRGDGFVKITNLDGTNFEGANLERASMTGVNLEGANMVRANLVGANLLLAFLRGTNFANADLRWVNLESAELMGAVLANANLEGANIAGANLSAWGNSAEREFVPASLAGANLTRANLSGANLAEVDLQEAILMGADLRSANLQGAYLARANLQGARVTDEQLATAKSLEGAIMPDGMKHV